MRAFQFSRPKGPGFGISRDFYLSVLSSHAVLPSILLVANPKAEGGAVEGFGAPLAADADKDALNQPLVRGAYAIATKDRKTVLKMLVLSREEAGFDPEPIFRSPLVAALDPEAQARLRATWTLAQLTFESHDAAVYPSVSFLLSVAQRLALLTEGLVADPVSRRYLLPEGVFHLPQASDKIDARDVVQIATVSRPDGLYAYTLGMQKFSLPEFEVPGVQPGAEESLGKFLIAVCQAVLLNGPIHSGAKLGAAKMPFEVREGGLDRALWEGISVFELLPPTSHTASEAIEAWLAETGR